MGNLNVKEVLNAKPGRHSDGGGLILDVKPTGRAYWTLRYTSPEVGKDGKRIRRDMVLGVAERSAKAKGADGTDAGSRVLTLLQARAEAARIRAKAEHARKHGGADPLTLRKAEQQAKPDAATAAEPAAAQDRSFRAVAEMLIASKGKAWKGGLESKHALQWSATLATHAYPVIGGKDVADITDDDVRTILEPLLDRTPETASRLRGRIENVIDVAIAKGWRTAANPASLRRLKALAVMSGTRNGQEVQHHPSLPRRQVPAFVHALRQKDGVSPRAILFAILTAARSGEVRGMRWREVRKEHLDELGRDHWIWERPAERMKAKKAHRIPLSAPALAILDEMRAFGDAPDDLVFPGKRRNAMLSDMALSMLVRGMCLDGLKEGEPPRWRDQTGRPIVPHGFRSSFKDFCRNAGFDDELSELALAHVERKATRKAYAREDLLERRVAIMEAWAEHVMRGPGEVAKLAERRTA